MAKRDNHYEAAFEAFLRDRRIPYVAVDEAKRSRVPVRESDASDGERTLKSADFLVSPTDVPWSWVVDVKGRRFPAGKQFWKNWSTGDELRSLSAWEGLLGSGFVGLLVFAYHVTQPIAPVPTDELFSFRGSLYGFVGARLDHYLSWSRRVSPRWDTYSMPAGRFREVARTGDEWFATHRSREAAG